MLMSRYKMFHVPFNQIHYILAILNLSLIKMNLNEFKLNTLKNPKRLRAWKKNVIPRQEAN